MSTFKDKTLLITGGTGSFGNAVLNGFLETDIKEIRIFSRDEKKQDDMRHEFQAKMPEASNKIKFFIGDVRDLASVKNAMHGVDYIFHAAALKQVPSCEFFPIEAVKTNVLGTENVLTAAIEEGVKSVICLSTDKSNCRSRSRNSCIAACDHKYRLSDPIGLYYQLWFDCRPWMCDRRRRTYFSGDCDQGRKSDSKSNKN